MKKSCSSVLVFLLVTLASNGQGLMFDDFNYDGVDDQELGVFNEWVVVDGRNGPPAGAIYRKENVRFIDDLSLQGNRIVTLSTTVDGATGNSTQARIQTKEFEYFEGTYAARVYYTDKPNIYGDANIQTFYTIVNYLLSGDGTKYSELDFEYMASDKWGVSTNNEVLYLTAWNRYIADPWQAWKRYWADDSSYEGWHTFVVSCTDGVNVNYYIDGLFITSMATTDSDGSSVYPRSPMQIAFANWIWNNVVGSSTEDRESTMEVDWVLFKQDTTISPSEVESIVQSFRDENVVRQNLSGEKVIDVTSSIGDAFNESIKTYPNPVEDVLYIENEYEGKVTIYDNMGRARISGSKITDGLNVSSLPSGVYWLKFNKDFTSKPVKFVKQ